jgi:hypothetical protein
VVRFPVSARGLSLLKGSQTGSETHPPPFQWARGVVFTVVWRTGFEHDSLLQSSFSVKNECLHSATYSCAFVACLSVNSCKSFVPLFEEFFFLRLIEGNALDK